MKAVRGYVDAINADPDALADAAVRGSASRYVLSGDEDFKGRVEIKFYDNVGKGVACNLESDGVFVFVFVCVVFECGAWLWVEENAASLV